MQLILSRNSWLFKWAYLPERITDQYIPERSSVCPIFWRVILGVPMFVIIGTFIVSVTFPLALAYQAISKYLKVKRGLNLEYALTRPLEDTFVWQRILAIKHKVCPIVRIEP